MAVFSIVFGNLVFEYELFYMRMMKAEALHEYEWRFRKILMNIREKIQINGTTDLRRQLATLKIQSVQNERQKPNLWLRPRIRYT